MTRKTKTSPAKATAPKAARTTSPRTKARTVAPTVAALPATPLINGAFDMTGPVSAEKIEAYLLTLNEKAKAALDKGAKLGEEFTELAKGNLEAAAESTKVAAKAAETFAQDGAALAKQGYEEATAAFKRYSTVKTPAELMQLNSELAKTSLDATMAQVSKANEALAKFATDFFQPLSGRYTVAVEKLKATAL